MNFVRHDCESIGGCEELAHFQKRSWILLILGTRSSFVRERSGFARTQVMKDSIRHAFRIRVEKLGYGLFDLRKDQSPMIFLAGHLRSIFEMLDVNCVIDVGANRGQFASMIRTFYKGPLVSMEPESTSFAALLECARSDSAWKTLNVALGAHDEQKVLNVFASTDLSSFLEPTASMSVNLRDSEVVETQLVKVVRLDSIFSEIAGVEEQPRVFLKIDTQGYDLAVLRGGLNSLKNVVALQSELSVIPLYDGAVDYLDALRYYRELGFEPTAIFPVAHDRLTKHVLEFDAVFTKRGKNAAPAVRSPEDLRLIRLRGRLP